MDEARIDRAMNRIGAALTRIEKAATAAFEGPSGDGQRDDRLRRRVKAALAELDELIAGLER